MDCLIGMQEIPDGSVDLIICDHPYGTIKGIGKGTDTFNKDTTWDVVIPTDRLFDQYERVLRRGGQVVLFSQEPYTHQLRNFVARNMDFCYPMVWYKDSCGNPLLANISPVSRFEDISVWVKKHDSENVHPLRDYARDLVKYIGKDYKAVAKDLIKRGMPKPTSAQHFLAYDCNQFHICTFETYDLLDRLYGISKWGGVSRFLRTEGNTKRVLRKVPPRFQFAGRKGERIQRPGVRERYGYLAPNAKAGGTNRAPYTPI